MAENNNELTEAEISLEKIRTLANSLIAEAPNSFEFSVGKENLNAMKGIEQNINMQGESNLSENNLLGKNIEYKIIWKEAVIPISIQLYENTANHYRIFGYTSYSGMLFSVNLTTASKKGDAIALEQTLIISAPHKLSEEARKKNRDSLVDCLLSEGFEITDTNKIILGYYDLDKNSFVDTSAAQFIKDFVKVAVIKGHFMMNKGVSLPFLDGSYQVDRSLLISDPDSIHKRQIPVSLRWEKLNESKGKCSLCGRSAEDGVKLHVDHIIPFSKGGKTESKNLQVLCQDCNLGKGNKL